MIINPICKIEYPNLKEKIRNIFKTEYILYCFTNGSEDKFKEVYMQDEIKNFLADTEIVYTAKQFFKNNLNITKTSKDSFMHRNTLIYRIGIIQKITGLNIKNFDDAVILQNFFDVLDYFNTLEKNV